MTIAYLLVAALGFGVLFTSPETTIVAINPDTNLMLFGLGDGFWKVLKPGDIADVVGRYVTVGGERRSGTVARSVFGGIVAGSTGAVVGALTAPTQGLGYQELRGIEIHTDDLKKPVLKLGSLIFRDDALPSVKEITPGLPESTIFLTDLLPELLAFARRRSIARPISTVRAEWPEGQSNRAGAGVEEDVDRRYCTDRRPTLLERLSREVSSSPRSSATAARMKALSGEQSDRSSGSTCPMA